MSLSVKFNGVELNKYLIVKDLKRGVGPTYSNKLQKLGLAHGESFIGTTRDSLVYEMEFTLLYDVLDKRRELAGILNVREPKMLIFGDEPDIGCLAIPDGDINVDEKKLYGVGKITWIIPSGFCFSINTRKFTASMSADNILSMEVDNRGTVETPLSVTAEIKDDNGYFGIVGPNSTLEFGKILEADGYVDMSEWVFRHHVIPSEESAFGKNNGVINWKTSNGGDTNKQQGSFKFSGQVALADNFGTPPNNSAWYGPSLSKAIPTKTSDSKRDGNWKVRQWLVHRSKGTAKKLGRQELNLSAGSTSIASFVIYDDTTTALRTRAEFWIYGKMIKRIDLDKTWREFYGSIDIWLEGDTINFKLYHEPSKKAMTYSFTDERYTTQTLDKWTYWASKYRNNQTCEMSLNYLDFQWIGTQNFVDVPNRYGNNDVLFYDGNDGKYYVNDALTMNDIVQGSLDIMIPPGKHTVEFYYSDFCEIPPVVTAEIRERWL